MAVAEKSNANKTVYKLEIKLLTYIPYMLALAYISNTALAYFQIKAELLSAICGISILPFLFILISSFVFKFCTYHRMMIYYVGISELLSWIDYYYIIPIRDNTYFIIMFIIFGIFLFLTEYFRIRQK